MHRNLGKVRIPFTDCSKTPQWLLSHQAQGLRVTVLAAEDDGQHICIDPHVERAYHQCGFRWPGAYQDFAS